jgi:hypothetical protein
VLYANKNSSKKSVFVFRDLFKSLVIYSFTELIEVSAALATVVAGARVLQISLHAICGVATAIVAHVETRFCPKAAVVRIEENSCGILRVFAKIVETINVRTTSGVARVESPCVLRFDRNNSRSAVLETAYVLSAAMVAPTR